MVSRPRKGLDLGKVVVWLGQVRDPLLFPELRLHLLFSVFVGHEAWSMVGAQQTSIIGEWGDGVIRQRGWPCGPC